jgi:hypothetical protein
VTLVYGVSTPRTAWLLVDRRLSRPGRKPDDTGLKLLSVDTTDGKLLIGYCGLGKTPLGLQPSEWMARTLRGVNLPLEQSLEILRAAAERRLPKYLNQIGGYHAIIAVGFRNGEPRTYGIDVTAGNPPRIRLFRRTWKIYEQFGQHGPMIAAGGTGALALGKEQIRSRILMHIIKRHERGLISPIAVARYLAGMNLAAARGDKSKQVSNRCVVAWRPVVWRKGDGGGGQIYFDGLQREHPSDGAFPVLSNGDDIQALGAITMKHFLPIAAAHRNKEKLPQPDADAINADLDALPRGPDDQLE